MHLQTITHRFHQLLRPFIRHRCTVKSTVSLEWGRSILPEIVKKFCASPYVNQNNYVDTLLRLQEIFFCYKNEMLDEISDEELLQFMQEQFDSVCFGDLDYLEGTCLEIFAQAIRAGYRGQQRTAGRDEFARLDINIQPGKFIPSRCALLPPITSPNSLRKNLQASSFQIVQITKTNRIKLFLHELQQFFIADLVQHLIFITEENLLQPQ